MIWHNHARADPCAMQRAFFPKTQKSFVDWRRCQNVASVFRAGGEEVNRRLYEHNVETTALFPNFDAHRAPLTASHIHGLRFLIGLRFTAGEFVGVSVELVEVVATGSGTGKANVADGKGDAVADTPGEGDGVALGDASGLCTGVGVGEGRMIFSQ
jgi:hypothetical protein